MIYEAANYHCIGCKKHVFLHIGVFRSPKTQNIIRKQWAGKHIY